MVPTSDFMAYLALTVCHILFCKTISNRLTIRLRARRPSHNNSLHFSTLSESLSRKDKKPPARGRHCEVALRRQALAGLGEDGFEDDGSRAGGEEDGFGGGGEVEGGGFHEESGEGGDVFGVEGEVDVVGEVGMEGGGGEAEFGGGGVAEFVEVEEAEGAGGVEVGDDVGGGDVGAGGPDGEDGGEAGHGAPLFDDVVDVEFFGGDLRSAQG